MALTLFLRRFPVLSGRKIQLDVAWNNRDGEIVTVNAPFVGPPVTRCLVETRNCTEMFPETRDEYYSKINITFRIIMNVDYFNARYDRD